LCMNLRSNHESLQIAICELVNLENLLICNTLRICGLIKSLLAHLMYFGKVSVAMFAAPIMSHNKKIYVCSTNALMQDGL
jgi:hypothetical protein